jgi:hypothetical protein
MKKILYLYQRAFWYVGLAKNEALKPLGFWNETLLILTWLAVNNQRPALKYVLAAYAGVLVLATLIGKVIVMLGIVRYNTKIANHQNPELMEILGEIKKLTEKMDQVIISENKIHKADDTTFFYPGRMQFENHNHCWREDGSYYGAYAEGGKCGVINEEYRERYEKKYKKENGNTTN